METEPNGQVEGRVKIKTGFHRYWAFHKTLGSIVGFGGNNEIYVRPDLEPATVLTLYPQEIDPREGTVLPEALMQAQLV